MLIQLHQISAALYLAAGVAGGVSVALSQARARRASVWLLAAAALLHIVSFVFLHEADPVPRLTDLPAALSLMTCLASLSFLAFLRRGRWDALVVLIAPIGFLGAFFAALRLPHASEATIFADGSLPHAHVILASAGLALLGVAGLAGAVFLREARALKHKRPVAEHSRLPSLEALDHVNLVALAVGFPLLTLGVLTGMMWLQGASGELWTGSAHEIWTTIAWAIYAVLAVSRFVAKQSARSAAASAVGGFAFLLFAVVGVGFAS